MFRKKKRIALIVSIILVILAIIAGVVCAVTFGKNNQHVYEEIVDVKYLKTAATCESGAIYYKSCECGEASEDETFEYGLPLGHDYGTLIAEDPATCTESGVKAHYHCTRCAHNFGEDKAEISGVDLVIPAKGHDYGTWIDGKPATETEDGEKGHYHCPDCGKNFDNDDGKTEIEDIVIPPVQHKHEYTQEVVADKYKKSDATCTESAVYYKSCACGEKGTETFESGIALGHDYGAWVSNENGTHTKTCSHDSSHKVTEDCSGGTATCEDKAECEYCHEQYGEPLGHDYGAWISNGDGTHTKECSHDSSHKVTESCSGGTATCEDKAECEHCHAEYGTALGHTYGTWIAEIPATEEATGVEGHYHCSVCSKNFDAEYNEIDNLIIPEKDHVHSYDLEVTTNDYLANAATCTKSAVYYKSCRCGAYGEDTFTYGDPLGHRYSTVTYEWDTTYTSCTATRTCGREGCSYYETADGTVGAAITQHLACTANELTTYTATFEEDWCTDQTETVTTALAPGHSFGEVRYEWNSTYTSCMAIRVCADDESHVERTMSTKVTSDKTQELTCTLDEITTYTATFGKDWCETQTKEVTTATAKGHVYQNVVKAELLASAATCTSPAKYYKSCTCGKQSIDTFTYGSALNHDYGETQYDWSSDNLTCTATRTCGRSDCGHSEEETVDTVKTVTQSKTCELAELSTFTAKFVNEWCEVQIKTGVQTAEAAGHTYGEWIEEVAATCTSTGMSAHYLCSACGKYFDESKIETTKSDLILAVNEANHVYGSWIDKVAATCTGTGTKAHKQCTECHKNFDADGTEIEDLTITALGHTYDDWVDKVEATCTVDGCAGYYYCSTCNKYYDKSGTKIGDNLADLKIEKLGHDFVNYECTRCDETDYPDQSLEYTYDENTGTYSVTGIGKCTESAIYIPAEYYDKTPVTSIGDNAFKGNTTIKSVTIAEGVTSIGECAFYQCSNLVSVKLPESLTTLDAYVFNECKKLSQINLDNVETLGYAMFRYCTALTSVTLNSKVTTLPAYSFTYCSGLKSIIIPDSVISLGSYVFSYCSALTTVEMSENVTWIGNYAFVKCYKLSSITIPEGVETIYQYMFSECSSLTSIIIPDSVTEIQTYAFHNTGLKWVVLGSGVNKIGSNAFGNGSMTFYYKGASSAWGKWTINTVGNQAITKNAKKYYYSATEVSGYWHYDESGNPVLW